MIVSPPKLLLTFDDGPHPQWTNHVLDLLDAHKVKGIFFCIGHNVERFPEITKTIIERGHSIGNHTWNHYPIDPLIYSRMEFEVERVHTYFAEKYGYMIKTFRSPWGILSRSAESNIRLNWGYGIFRWDIDLYDYIWPFSRRSLLYKSTIQTEQIILMHDGNCYSPLSSRKHMLISLSHLLQRNGTDICFIDPEEAIAKCRSNL